MRKVVNIIVHDDAGVVSTSIAGLAWSAADMVIGRAYKEALRLLETRASRRRFRRPVIYRSFDEGGRLIMKHDKSGWTWGGDNPEFGEPGSIVFEDRRGRKAFVRIEIES